MGCGGTEAGNEARIRLYMVSKARLRKVGSKSKVRASLPGGHVY